MMQLMLFRVSYTTENCSCIWHRVQSKFIIFGRLSTVAAFADVIEKLLGSESQWENYVKQMESNEINILAVDGSCYRSDLTSFQKLLLFSCFQPSKLVDTLLPFICEILGSEFIESPPFDLAASFADSTCCKPLLFILSSNYDPIKSIRQLAETQLIDPINRLTSLSMGQQQNSLAIKLIEDGIKSGDWVILQNCHLATDWMCTLERILENLAPDTTNQDFRLWLTTQSTHQFPLSIIHGSVKLVNEPPKTLRTTLMRTFCNQPVIDENWISENKHSMQLKSMLYSLSFLHAIILERRNFNSIGWNYPYDFNDTDLFMSIYQFYEYLNAFNTIPFELLQTLLAESNYGGHMNDFCDLKCLQFFTEYFCSRTFCENGKLASDTTALNNIEAYFPHNYSTIDSITSHIKCLDTKCNTSICGLHYNANTLRERNQTNFLIENVILAQVFCHLTFILFSLFFYFILFHLILALIFFIEKIIVLAFVFYLSIFSLLCLSIRFFAFLFFSCFIFQNFGIPGGEVLFKTKNSFSIKSKYKRFLPFLTKTN